MAVRWKSGRDYQTDCNFIWSVAKFAFGILHFWHMAIGLGHVVFAMNTRCQFHIQVLRFQRIGVFVGKLVQSEETILS